MRRETNQRRSMAKAASAATAIFSLAVSAWAAAQPDFSYSRPKTPPVPMPPAPTTRPTPPEIRFGVHRPFNPIDRFILARLQAEKRVPRALCDDVDFLRRSSLDLCGVIPTADDVAEFMKQPGKERRRKWIDTLLSRQMYADHWTSYWGDLLGERANIRGVPRNAFRRYIHENLKQNRPFDAWVREMIAAEGTSEDAPQTAFLLSREEADPQKWANALTVAVTQVFQGVQLKCAECHDHPFEWWTQKDFEGMADFFGGTRRRVYRNESITNRGRRIDVPFFEVVDNARRARGTFLTGVRSERGRGREALAELVTRRDNPYFARVTVNRLWAKMMGTGLVNPVDALGPRNPPSHPELLDWLACEFIESGYDVKHILRLISNSRVYQLSSDENVATLDPVRRDEPADDERMAGSLFNAMPLRRMTAEQFHDSLLAATGRYLPDDPRFEPSISVAYPPREGSFLRTFGVTDRLTLLPRDPSETIQQALMLLNGDFINSAVKLHEAHPIRRWKARGYSQAQIVEALFVQFLTRKPGKSELAAVMSFLGTNPRDEKWEDVQWALLNTREFQFIR